MFKSQTQKIRKHQKPISEKDTKLNNKVKIRKAKRGRHSLWIIKEEL